MYISNLCLMAFSITLLACDIRAIVRLFEHAGASHFFVLVHRPIPSIVFTISFLSRFVGLVLLTPLLLLRLLPLTVLWVFHQIRVDFPQDSACEAFLNYSSNIFPSSSPFLCLICCHLVYITFLYSIAMLALQVLLH